MTCDLAIIGAGSGGSSVAAGAAQLGAKVEDEVVRNVLLHAQPTRQFVTVEQVGALAVLRASSAAASITGAALPIEGGWTSQ